MAIKTIVDCHISIPFPCFVRDLISSYLGFLKERKIPAAIYYEDVSRSSEPMICLKSSHADEVSHVFISLMNLVYNMHAQGLGN